ncbi:hypothetical protein GDO81_017610 [Engystomops pustulosus]|uniref:Uncharacterized protein n=1 Tax=Engystomops pustulosus TaxID=76066 RepID=A0AAV7A5P5_ENGPU|nr:hypothetical protein GDO81_017610 [Engystomops pustulosus]
MFRCSLYRQTQSRGDSSCSTGRGRRRQASLGSSLYYVASPFMEKSLQVNKILLFILCSEQNSHKNRFSEFS